MFIKCINLCLKLARTFWLKSSFLVILDLFRSIDFTLVGKGNEVFPNKRFKTVKPTVIRNGPKQILSGAKDARP